MSRLSNGVREENTVGCQLTERVCRERALAAIKTNSAENRKNISEKIAEGAQSIGW